jgi:hypothetical protein
MSLFKPHGRVLTLLVVFLAFGGTPVSAGVKEKNDLRQIALFYRLFDAEFNRGPKSLQEFQDYIKRDAAGLKKALANGTYVLIVGKKLGAKDILAYEKKPDKGSHIVARGDGSVTTMSLKELKEALKK